MGFKVVGSKSTALLGHPVAKPEYTSDAPKILLTNFLFFYYSTDFPYFQVSISSFQKNS